MDALSTQTTATGVRRQPLYGVMGCPVGHSLSPLMHNYALRRLGLPGVYAHLETRPEALAQAVAGLRAVGAAGWNVTVPHKKAIIPLLDRVDDEARFLGAVNTVTNRDGELTGSNTDEPGFRLFLEREGIDCSGARALVLGAGGSAPAVGAALVRLGARVVVSNRTESRARELAKMLSRIDKGDENYAKIECARFCDAELRSVARDAAIIVNTTPVGMAPDVGAAPLDSAWLPKDGIVIDLVYNPPRTMLLTAAMQKGLKVYNGLEMLIHQGAMSFSIWTGAEPPVDMMRKALELG